MVTAYECESCHTIVYYEGKRDPYCPMCRGMMLKKEMEKPKEAKKIKCPQCDQEYSMMKEPFKCPFCDHSLSFGAYW